MRIKLGVIFIATLLVFSIGVKKTYAEKYVELGVFSETSFLSYGNDNMNVTDVSIYKLQLVGPTSRFTLKPVSRFITYPGDLGYENIFAMSINFKKEINNKSYFYLNGFLNLTPNDDEIYSESNISVIKIGLHVTMYKDNF